MVPKMDFLRNRTLAAVLVVAALMLAGGVWLVATSHRGPVDPAGAQRAARSSWWWSAK